MDIKNQARKAKDKISNTIEGRLERVEQFISKRGIGSSKLEKAKRVQRNVNLVVAAGSIVAIAGIVGIAAWARAGSDEEDDADEES